MHKDIEEFVKKLLPDSELREENNGNFTFKVPLAGLKVSSLFDEIESVREGLGISDWGIS